VENAYEIRRHPASLRYSLIATYGWLRAQKITDGFGFQLLPRLKAIHAQNLVYIAPRPGSLKRIPTCKPC